MNILSNRTRDDSTRRQVRRHRLAKMHIMRVSLLFMFMTMVILSGVTLSNVFTSAAHAASNVNTEKAVRQVLHIGMARTGRTMVRVGSPPPDLAILSVTPALSITVPSTVTIHMDNLGGPTNRDANTPNFIQANIQVSGLLSADFGIPTPPTASGTGWSCGTAAQSKSVVLVGAPIPVTYSFNCNYTGGFPVVAGTLKDITVTGTNVLFPPLVAQILALPINVQLVTLYDTNPANNNFLQAGSFAPPGFFPNLPNFILPTAGLSKTVISGTSPFAPGQNVTYRLQPTLSGLTGLLAGLITIPTGAPITLFMDDYLPPGQSFVSFTSNGTLSGFSWTCNPIANTRDTGVTDVQCSLPASPATLTAVILNGLAVGGVLTIPSVDITGQFNAAALALDYAPNYTNTADFYFLDPPAGIPAFAGVVTTDTVQTTTGAALSLSKTGVRHGNEISYTLLSSIVSSIVGNTGLVPAGTVITLTDTLPTQETLLLPVLQSASTTPWTINVSGNTITATLTAPAGGLVVGTVLPAISFNAAINAGTRNGTIIENEATISATGFAPVSASSTIEVGEQHAPPAHINCDDNCHQNQNECKNDQDDCHHNQCPHVASTVCDHNGNKDTKDHSTSKDSKSHSGSTNSKGSSSNSGSHSGSSNSSSSVSHSGSSNSSSSSDSHHAIIARGLSLIHLM